ncbi:ATP-dependent Clp protease adapter protein ClpS [Porphyridium purpureum]|uniref:ATP-dependent Clp protease adapter protein ClpS n=1 Tax=Porphyridium purpureum TaxID=35688 RepID=A0A5J4Z5M8_PORPP|nr:ATP-dependent Clp protease adapter protein ClpS [Porphyridium purpureum]|eukprot:POR5392..scf295_1
MRVIGGFVAVGNADTRQARASARVCRAQCAFVQDGMATATPAVVSAMMPAHRAQLAPGIKVGRPKTSIQKDTGRMTETKSPEPQADAAAGASRAKPRRETEMEEIPMYKVILLGDEEYDEVHVVTQLMKIVQLEQIEATRIFGVAQATGSEIVVVVNEELAEFYVQQLKRQELYAIMERDE